MNKNGLLLVFLCLTVFAVNAQVKEYNSGKKLPQLSCYASGKVEKSFVPPGDMLKSAEAKCDIVVTYHNFPDSVKNAFEYAVNQWEKLVESDMPIRMDATWSDDLEEGTLGSCGPETYYANFEGAPYEDIYYPVAIAEKISNEELNGGSRPDIVANFSSKINWYFGTDGQTPISKYDLVSVVMHEICHGLGFTGFFFESNNLVGYGNNVMGEAASFDVLLERSVGERLIDTSEYANPSVELKQAVTTNLLYAASPAAKAVNNGARPRLYAPVQYNGGSSIYHLNESTYPNGNENSLMTYALGYGEAIHDPGPLTRGIMEDIGWADLIIRFDPLKDMEEVGTLSFNVSLESKYEIDSSALYVVYSADGFQSHSDSLALVPAGEAGLFVAEITPQQDVEDITYFVEVHDKLGRVKNSPSTIPQSFHTVKFGPDNEKPEISHTPIPYFLVKEEQIIISAMVEDNLGIDTVFVEYSVNHVAQQAFGLVEERNNIYSGSFPVDITGLSDGDSIHYSIVAIDGSTTQNRDELPGGGEKFGFAVNEIFDPVNCYVSDFNQGSSDFLLSDFSIYTADGFENAALHSPHPYASPRIDNQDFDFWTFLKKPIIIKESGTMTFDEVVLVEPGDPDNNYGDDNFWDYVIVEGSKDLGETWFAFEDGYDSGDDETWKIEYNAGIPYRQQDSKTEGKSDWYVNREISLVDSENFQAGDTVLVRFRLYSDPYANGWGWVIDNLRIQQPLASPTVNLLSEDVKVFPNPFKSSVNITISLADNLSGVNIEFYNLMGQKVYAETNQNFYDSLTKKIDLSYLESGIYVIKVSGKEKQLFLKKLIKN